MLSSGHGGQGPSRPGRADVRVIAAMSGGVDSSVAAARMVDAGHEVVGVHLALSRSGASAGVGVTRVLHPRRRPRRAARGRQARHPVLRVGPVRAVPRRRDRGLRRRVPQRPHPQSLPALQREDQVLGRARPRARDGLRRWWPPGHYARIVQGPDGPELHRAVDPAKDQSYVLGVLDGDAARPFGLPARRRRQGRHPRRGRAPRAAGGAQARQPRHLLHPRRRHRRVRPVAGRRGSRRRRRRRRPARSLAHHEGAHAFTIGQRRGLNLRVPAADGAPRYVVDVDIVTSTVRVGPPELLDVDVIEGIRVVWAGPPWARSPCGVRGPGAGARPAGAGARPHGRRPAGRRPGRADPRPGRRPGRRPLRRHPRDRLGHRGRHPSRDSAGSTP